MDNTLRLRSTNILNLSSSISISKSACNDNLTCTHVSFTTQGISVDLPNKPSFLKVNYAKSRYALNCINPISRRSWLAHLTVSAIMLVFYFKASRKAVIAKSVRP